MILTEKVLTNGELINNKTCIIKREMGDRINLPPEKIKEALLEHYDGSLADVAAKLRVSRWTLENRISRNKSLQQVLHDVRAGHFDKAVRHLTKRIYHNDVLLMFFLKTQGHRYGYNFRETQIVEQRNIDMGKLSDDDLKSIIETGEFS